MSIGLESRFRELTQQAAGGRPIQLYLVGQTFNVILTLLAAYFAFGGILFDRIPLQVDHAKARNVIANNVAEDVEATALFYTEVPEWGNRIRQDQPTNTR